MKKFKPAVFIMLFAGMWLVSTSYSFRPQYSYEPFYMTRAELSRSVFYSDGGREMSDPGKIWVRGSQIFVNERYRGVHIIDNSNPSKPEQTGFIVAPGCIDMAVKDDIIYLDNAVDLVAFDMAAGKVTKRMENFFAPPSSPDGRNSRGYGREGYILVGWSRVDNK